MDGHGVGEKRRNNECDNEGKKKKIGQKEGTATAGQIILNNSAKGVTVDGHRCVHNFDEDS